MKNQILDKLNDIYETPEEKKQKDNGYFEQSLKDKIINHFKTILDNAPENNNKIFYVWKTSGTTSSLSNYIAQFIYNDIRNVMGDLIRIVFITKSGSEGISFKAIRQVHIIEPFWQQTRETQVIGRAVRRGSHNELETSKRKVYAGGIGYFSSNGEFDTCIALRTAIAKKDKFYVQAGAGIVADSNPIKEYEETINKAKALLNALK